MSVASSIQNAIRAAIAWLLIGCLPMAATAQTPQPAVPPKAASKTANAPLSPALQRTTDVARQQVQSSTYGTALATPPKGRAISKNLLLVLGIGAAVAAGSILSIRSGNNPGGSTTTTVPTTVTVGTIAIGGPQ